MMDRSRILGRRSTLLGGLTAVALVAVAIYLILAPHDRPATASPEWTGPAASAPRLPYRPRIDLDLSGFAMINATVKPWPARATLGELRDIFDRIGYRTIESIDRSPIPPSDRDGARASQLISRSLMWNAEGEPEKAYRDLAEARTILAAHPDLARQTLYTVIFAQGVASMRRGENDNCVMCLGESLCILPISPAAVHSNPEGSRAAIRHFAEYLDRFPDDLEARWLLNVAHMTLGDHPAKVDPKHLIRIDGFTRSEFDIGKFRDVGRQVGVNRLNQAGGAIMDDFDGDGLFDIVTTAFDPTARMAFYRNQGDGKFEDRAESAGLADQLGGLYCVQADYDNDGHLDIFIPRGAWLQHPVRPSLLRNNGDGTFADVTERAGLLDPVNSNSASWADYDNDGFLDLYVCCERQANRLYRNKGDGTFEEVAGRLGVEGGTRAFCKGSAWIDFDNDDDPDLFLNNLNGSGRLFRNDREKCFVEVTQPMRVDGPRFGFSCWAWDYDNDGWLDLFATSYVQSTTGVVKGLMGVENDQETGRLFRNLKGERFDDVTREAGLDKVFAAMGTNFGDFDNDGYLDMYLGTGEPSIAMLVPNRMLKNVDGERFADITGSSGTGHLQKGHGVAIGDWDRDGDVDLFIEMGGAIDGDKYRNILFQNPGGANRSISLKLVGTKSNRSAIGARIKVVTAGPGPRTIYRHVSTGSSFGANPLEQTIGLGPADRVATLEIRWPTSGTTQVFRDLPAGQAFEITERSAEPRRLDRKPIPAPK